MFVRQPVLTVRSMAELCRLPVAQKVKILHEQKYPKKEPQIFRTPYYIVPLAGIRKFYRSGNDSEALRQARSRINSISNTTRRTNNERVLDQFERDATQLGRHLQPQTNKRYTVDVSMVHLKLSTDLNAIEGKRPRFIYYNCKRMALGGIFAEDTLAIAHWLLRQNQLDVPADALEYIDLFAGKVYRLRDPRPAISRTLLENARIIEELWPTV